MEGKGSEELVRQGENRKPAMGGQLCVRGKVCTMANRKKISGRKRDYSMNGLDGQRAIESGLAAAKWYHSHVPREEMKALMARSDQPAIRDTIILFVAMVISALLTIAFWPSWWALLFWFAYSVLYGSAMDSRWHECGHGTAFKTRKYNDWLYQIASFCMIRNPVSWKYSHARHHTNTIIIGRDPEIALKLPPRMLRNYAHFFGLLDCYLGLRSMFINAAGRIEPDVAEYTPATEHPKIILIARIWLLIYIGVIALALFTQSILPLLLIGLPKLAGSWHYVMCGALQHGGLAENVIDHRLNSRTVLINPVSRFIYWNMNYHVEHHMFPLVPYHRLPDLHERIKHDLPAPNPNLFHALSELGRAMKRQWVDDRYYLKRELPPSAKPYREEFHQYVPG